MTDINNMTTQELINWQATYQSKYPGTNSARDMVKALEALMYVNQCDNICGSLDTDVANIFRQLINDRKALSQVIRMHWSHNPKSLREHFESLED